MYRFTIDFTTDLVYFVHELLSTHIIIVGCAVAGVVVVLRVGESDTLWGIQEYYIGDLEKWTSKSIEYSDQCE